MLHIDCKYFSSDTSWKSEKRRTCTVIWGCCSCFHLLM